MVKGEDDRTNGLESGPSRELIDRLHRAAWAICGSPHDAEDLVQETFARVLSRPRVFRAGDPAPYLMQALRNTHLNSLRTASRRPRTVELAVDEGWGLESKLAEPEVVIEHRATFEAIAALPDDFRAALVAVDIVGLSYCEAGSAFGVREATITSRLSRARQRVAKALSAGRR
jgi:RNA polymerase sigma-70 factor (ECF subfamily)